jgi:hypothetical protein
MIGMQSGTKLLAELAAYASVVLEKDTHIFEFTVSKDVAESFNLVSAKIGEQKLLVGPVPMTVFLREEKTDLERRADEVEALLDEMDLPTDGGSDSPLVALLNALPELLALIPRRIEPPPFSYFVPARTPIVFEVENTTSEPKVFRCAFVGQEMP